MHTYICYECSSLPVRRQVGIFHCLIRLPDATQTYRFMLWAKYNIATIFSSAKKLLIALEYTFKDDIIFFLYNKFNNFF